MLASRMAQGVRLAARVQPRLLCAPAFGRPTSSTALQAQAQEASAPGGAGATIKLYCGNLSWDTSRKWQHLPQNLLLRHPIPRTPPKPATPPAPRRRRPAGAVHAVWPGAARAMHRLAPIRR